MNIVILLMIIVFVSKKMHQEIIDPKSSPEARAERVRRLRNMANLSRQAMCNNSGIKLDTLIGWEVARHGGLTEKGAIKVINRVAQEGVTCTSNWLLYEIGYGPTVTSNFEEIQKKSATSTIIYVDEDRHIINELLFFRNNNPDSIALAIPDDCMSPPYNKGDYVSGIKRYQDKLHTIIGLDCIIQPINGVLLLRKLFRGDNQNKYNLICSNLTIQTLYPILSNVSIAYAAPVIWHRRKNPAEQA